MIDNPDSIFPPARRPEPPPHLSSPPPSDQTPSDQPPSGPFPPGPARPPRPQKLLIGLIVGISGLLCLCGVLLAVLFAFISNETSSFETVIDQYMSAMARQDAPAAYGMLSTRARQDITLEDLKSELRSNSYITYRGYQSTSVNSTSIGSITTDQQVDLSEADVEGVITYKGGAQVTFNASLDNEDGVWKLYIIQAQRAPGKDT